MEEKSVFQTLSEINVNDKTEQKGRLTYLSWSFAWGEVKKKYPTATYTIYENENGWNYFTDGRTCWVKTGVTINGIEHIEYLPVMDNLNKSIPVDKVTSFDVNKAIQRSITKACARHGLGLYIYAGEDLPEDETPEISAKKPQPAPKPAPVQKTENNPKLTPAMEMTYEQAKDVDLPLKNGGTVKVGVLSEDKLRTLAISTDPALALQIQAARVIIREISKDAKPINVDDVF